MKPRGIKNPILIIAFFLSMLTALLAEAPVRVLLLSDTQDDPRHGTTAFLRELLVDSGRFKVSLNEVPASIGGVTLNDFDLVVCNQSCQLSKSSVKALQSYVRSGKGMVTLRPAVVSGELYKLTGVKVSDGPSTRFEKLEIQPVITDHPVMRGFQKKCSTADKLLERVVVSKEAEVVAAALQTAVVVSKSVGKGRSISILLGHDGGAMQEKAFITSFLRSAEWAASGKVTLPEMIGMPGPKPGIPRILILTGGHDHHAAFFQLFDDKKEFGWVPVASSTVFQQDIRSKYDGLVFYDFTRELDETGRKNLRDFVEAGKGIVVLHHGILNFQKWSWWSEEVVGGRYRLQNEGEFRNSTVKFGEEHMIVPQGKHPVLQGIEPFHLTDETYKGLFISPNVQPLLLTDNPTSDKEVAWIGPSKTSRVVFIQLGHDQSPFQHPSYRKLVRNSLLWTTGKIN